MTPTIFSTQSYYPFLIFLIVGNYIAVLFSISFFRIISTLVLADDIFVFCAPKCKCILHIFTVFVFLLESKFTRINFIFKLIRMVCSLKFLHQIWTLQLFDQFCVFNFIFCWLRSFFIFLLNLMKYVWNFAFYYFLNSVSRSIHHLCFLINLSSGFLWNSLLQIIY